MDGKLYRSMKISRLIPFFLLAAGILIFPVAFSCPQQRQEGGDFNNFAAFREARMKLPERDDSFYPVAVEEIMLSRNFVQEGSFSQYRLVQSRKYDLDRDGVQESYILRDGSVTVKDGSRIIWQSEDDWWVDYLFLGDANNDGVLELNLLVWKEGSFGPYKPFWVEEEDLSVKNHLFIFKLEKGNFKPVWQSSNLAHPNYRAALSDIDGDGENELVAFEGSYTDPKQTEVTLWKWNGWGFTRIDLDLAEQIGQKGSFKPAVGTH
ncbi:MAG: hypothetical protein GX263_02260 [Firmicutes bacterium]|nr:hypothetical protein [Bacillota bacterium]